MFFKFKVFCKFCDLLKTSVPTAPHTIAHVEEGKKLDNSGLHTGIVARLKLV